MAGRAKAVSDEYKSALVDLTFNSKPMINLLTMLAEENNEYAQPIVNVICDRIKHVGMEQKMPALYLLDSILKNIGREYMAIISKNIVEVFCCVFEAAPDERKRMQLFKLRNTWNQYIPNKTLYELDVRVTRTDPNWPVAAPVVTTAPNVIHVNPKFLQKNDPSSSPITATLAASIVAEKEASKLQSKINKQRLLEEEKRVQEQLRILQADKLKRDREQHELMLQQQQQERERLIAEQKRQLEVLRKQQQNMSDSESKTATSTATSETKTTPSKAKVSQANTPPVKVSEVKVVAEVDTSHAKENDVSAPVDTKSPVTVVTEDKPENIEPEKETQKTSPVPPVIPHTLIKDPRGKNEVVNDPRLNRKKGPTNKSAINVMNKIVTNLSKGKPDAIPQVTPVRKIRPYINPIYAHSPVSIATARQSFASRSFKTLNLPVPSTVESRPLQLPKNAVENIPVCSAVPDCIIPICTAPVMSMPSLLPFPHNNNIIQSSVTSCVTSSIAASRNSNLIIVQCHDNAMSSSSIAADTSRPVSVTKSQFHATTTTKSVASVIASLPTTTTPVASVDSHGSSIASSSPVCSKSVSNSTGDVKSEPTVSLTDNVKSSAVICSTKDGVVVKSEQDIKISSGTTDAVQTSTSQVGPEPSVLTSLGETVAGPNVPPPFSGDFKSLSTLDMRIAAQAAAIATAMHQMQSGPGSSGVMAPEQSAQLAAHLIEIMQGTASAISTSSTSTTTTSTADSATNNKESTDDKENSNNDNKKQTKENLKVDEVNKSIARERSASSTKSDSKNNSRSREKVRERSPHDSDLKRETRHSKQRSEAEDEKSKSKQRSEEKDDEKSKQRSEGRDNEKLISPERNLRSRTRERDKPQAVLGDEPPSKRLKDNDQQERGRKARARSPSRYYKRMERKIVSDKRVELKEKELVLQRFRKVSDGDSTEQSKADGEKTSGGKERTSPVTVEKTGEEEELEVHQKEFNMLKERLYDIHKNKEKTGAIDQDMLTKVMVEIDQKAKDGVLAKDAKDDLMWQIRHIRAEAKHVAQKHVPKGKKPYTEHQDHEAPNTHLHWRSRKDHSHDPQGVPPERFGRPRGPRERFEGPVRPALFEEKSHIHEPMTDIRNSHPQGERYDEQRHGPPEYMGDGPPPEYMGDGPPPSHYEDGMQPHSQNRPPNTHEAQMPPHMRNNPHGSFMGEQPQQHHGPRGPYNSNEHQNMSGNTQMMDGPRPPHMMDGPRPPHMMEGQRPPYMDGPRPPHLMDGPRAPHMMDGPRPPHMMDGPRPPHMMDGPRPPHMMDGPRPPRPPHMMDGPRPPHMMDGPRMPHMMDGPRPPHPMDGPRPPPHLMDGPCPPPHMMDGPRPPHMMDGPPRPPPHLMDGPCPPHMMDGPRPPHLMDVPSHGPQTRIEGPQAPRFNVPQPPPPMPQPPLMPQPPHMDGPRPPHMDVPLPPRMDVPRPPHMDMPRPPHMDVPRPPHMEGPHPSHMLRPNHMGDQGHQPPAMMDMSNPAYRMEGPPGHMPPRPPFLMDGIQSRHPMSLEATQSTQSPHPYHPTDITHSQHSLMPQGHPQFHMVHGQSWAPSSNTFHPTIDAGASSSILQSLDVSSLLNQLSAAGLFSRAEEKNIPEPEVGKQEVPEIKLILDDLKVRNETVISNIIVGKQCSSCGERFPSEVHSEHLDWHFRQNRKEKGGVRKECRQWYFDLKDWVEQDTRKVFEDLKAQNAPTESEDENTEQTEEVVLSSQVEEPQKLVADDSIPVGETGEVCHVCMDPLEQYWDEDREEWRYKKAVREQNKTYHFHCFADYVPFEMEEEPTPPGTPLVPHAVPVRSPHTPPVSETNRNDKPHRNDQLDSTSELEISNDTSTLDVSSELNTTELNLSTQFNTTTSSEVDTPFDRLTVSMMEVIAPPSTDGMEITEIKTSASNNGDVSVMEDTPSTSPTDTTNTVDTENAVMTTIQDILRAASFNIKTKNNKGVTVNTKTVEVESTKTIEVESSSKNVIEVNEKELKLREEISALLSDMVDIVTKRLAVRESKTILMLPFVSSIMGNTAEIRGPKEPSIDTQSIPTRKINENVVLTERSMSSKCTEPISDKDINITDREKKELDEEQDIAYSPYIENMDSPVYPVITTSHLTCVEQEQDASFQKVNVVDPPNTDILPLEQVVADGNDDNMDSILADVALTLENLISKVTLHSQSISSCDNEDLKLFNDGGLSVHKLEPGVKEVGSDLNKSVAKVIDNISVDK